MAYTREEHKKLANLAEEVAQLSKADVRILRLMLKGILRDKEDDCQFARSCNDYCRDCDHFKSWTYPNGYR